MPANQKNERPFQGGAQPVVERPPEAPVPGWSVAQAVVVAVAAAAVIVAIVWLIVPLGA